MELVIMSGDYKTSFGAFSKDVEKSLVEVKISRKIQDGVYVWIETEGVGHAFISMHQSENIYVYSYGRYDDIDLIKVTGEGVLAKFQGKPAIFFIKAELNLKNYKIYKINDVLIKPCISFFDKLWNASSEKPDNIHKNEIWKKYGKVINKYNLFYRNCTTIIIDALKASGTKIFIMELHSADGFPEYRYEQIGIIAPLELKIFMETRMSSTKNISDATENMRYLFMNSGGRGRK